MVVPSAIGSLNGTPISTTSQALGDRGEIVLELLRGRKSGGEKPTSAGGPCAAAA
jgi:hypothetical protein